MSIDFCAEPFVERVGCNRECADDRGPTNLVSLSDEARNAGMIAESFVTPPVEFTVVFKFAIHVAGIRVYPRIVNHRTTSMELFFEGDRGHFFSVSRSRSATADTFHFENSDYRPRRVMVSKYGLGEYSRRPDIAEDSHWFRYRFGVKRIVLKLWSSLSPRSPGIGRLEVWGQPAFGTDELTVGALVDDLILHRRLKERSHHSAHSSPPLPASDETAESTAGVCSGIYGLQSKVETLNDLQDAFPDFFDPITYDLMTYPLLLPSGYTVDKTTLEKYCENELLLGRPPNDPFTRRPFEHPHLVPVPNTGLRERIDDVIRRRHACGRLLELGRAVGVDHPLASATVRTSNLVPSIDSSIATSASEPMAIPGPSDFQPQPKRLKMGNGEGRPALCVQVPAPLTVHSGPSSSHKAVLKRSLDDSIASVLADSVISSPLRSESPVLAPLQLPIRCGRCGSCMNLYRLPCGHLACRNCVNSLNSGRDVLTCAVTSCHQSLRKADVIKVHT